MEKFDVVVVGGGVIGVSIAYHLARFGCRRVLLLERGQLGGGTTAQSSCIVRTHYSVPENVALAQGGLATSSTTSPAYLDDPEADSGYNRCGLMLVAGEGPRADRAARDAGRSSAALGIDAREIAPATRGAIHPLLQLRRHRGDRLGAGRRLRRRVPHAHRHSRAPRAALGATLREGVAVTGLARDAHRPRHRRRHRRRAPIAAGVVISAQNIWSRELARWTGIDLPLTLSRHAVFTLEGADAVRARRCRC